MLTYQIIMTALLIWQVYNKSNHTAHFVSDVKIWLSSLRSLFHNKNKHFSRLSWFLSPQKGIFSEHFILQFTDIFIYYKMHKKYFFYLFCYGLALLPLIICLGRLHIACRYIFTLWQLHQRVDSLSYDMEVVTKEWSIDEKISRLSGDSNPVCPVKNPVL